MAPGSHCCRFCGRAVEVIDHKRCWYPQRQSHPALPGQWPAIGALPAKSGGQLCAIGSPGARSNRRIALQENQGQGIAMEVILPGLPVVDLSSIAAAIHYGCMGLPQELIDHIMDVLRNDFPSLKACSLTCKAMFASTRRLIHWTINLTERNNRNVLTPEELRRHNWGNPCDHTQLSILSHMGEGGLLRYARRVRIHTHGRFTMGVLITHLHYFQSLDRVHTLSIAEFDAGSWLPHLHGTFFGHFYPTLTSLTLYEPLYNLHLLLQFVLQFPELENLCLVWPRSDGPKFNTDPSVDHHPPLRGRLQLIGCDPVDRWPADFVREFPNGMNFRMVELESFHGAYAQNVLDGCAHTLEDLTFASYSVGNELQHLDFTGFANLRRITLRSPPIPSAVVINPGYLPRALSTITSPSFCELVLELEQYSTGFDWPSPQGGSRWEEVDKFLDERFSDRGDFKLTIRSTESFNWSTYQGRARDCFPLLARSGRINLETIYKEEPYR